AEELVGDREWKQLEMLSLQDNNITTLEVHVMRQLQSLTHLNLSSNLLIDIPSALSVLYNLHSLQLSHNMISSVTGIHTVLGNLHTLDLSSNRLVMLAGLDRLWALEKLDLRDNRIEDYAEVGRLTALPNLANVWIAGNPFTLLQSDYRTRLFGLFANAHMEIRLDGTQPSFLERINIQSTQDQPALSYAAATTAPSTATANANAWPVAQPAGEEEGEGEGEGEEEEREKKDDKSTKDDEEKEKEKENSKPKPKMAKRVIRLGQSQDTPKSQPQRMSRMAELEQAVVNETLARQSRRPRSRRSRSPGQESTRSNSTHRSLSPLADRSNDAFRRKIEAMRQEAGTEWLRVLQEME
ncbi:hypothetical protein BDF14DRAFT_1884403, partial [Spinellus fusiger]